MIYRDEIVFTDRDGDVLSAALRRGAADPVISVTHRLSEYDKAGDHPVMNSGDSQSVVFTEQEFIDTILPNLVRGVLGENAKITVTI